MPLQLRVMFFSNGTSEIIIPPHNKAVVVMLPPNVPPQVIKFREVDAPEQARRESACSPASILGTKTG